MWDRWAAANPSVPLRVFDNQGARAPHWKMLERMWAHAKGPESARYVIFTERDFLPGPRFLAPADLGVLAAEYCTRDPVTRGIVPHDIPGAWYIMFDRERLPAGWEPNFAPAGAFNDPANGMLDDAPESLDWGLIGPTDCWPDHWGAHVGNRGEHLFFSRHYGDPPSMRIAGLPLGDILRKVDQRIERYERETAAHASLPR